MRACVFSREDCARKLRIIGSSFDIILTLTVY